MRERERGRERERESTDAAIATSSQTSSKTPQRERGRKITKQEEKAERQGGLRQEWKGGKEEGREGEERERNV